MELEFQRNKERFAFLKWGSCAFHNMLVVPPGSGIVHQVRNLTSFIHIKILSLLLGKLAELCGAITDNRLKALLGCNFC